MVKSTERITLTVKELCEFLGVSSSLVYQLARANEIPHIRVGGRILFNKDLIVEWSKNPNNFENMKEVN